MHRLALFVALLAWTSTVRAEEARVTVTREACQNLVRHQPDADVVYQPGVDVYGRAVAPADLDGGIQLDIPQVFAFDIDIQPLAYARRREIAAARAELSARLGINAALARQLAQEGAALAEREADFLTSYGAAAAAIVAATGGPTETATALLAQRTAQLEALRTNRLGGTDYLALQSDLARQRQALDDNRGDAETLAQLSLNLDRDEARIAQRGLESTTMTVGRVVIDSLTGEASFNGQPLQAQAVADLVRLCREALKRR